MKMNFCLLVLTCMLQFIALAPAGATENSRASEKADEPIQEGYLFLLDKFIPGPYLVVTNGQQVTVNGVVVFESHEKPGNEKNAVAVIPADPGPPPAGLSPLDDSQEALDYWVEKSVYLNRALDIEAAKRLFMEAVIESKCGVKAWIDDSHPNGVMLQGKDSRPEYFPIRNVQSFAQDPDAVGSAEKYKNSQARVLRNTLKSGRVIWVANLQGAISVIPPSSTDDFLRVMTDESGIDLKLIKLTTLNAIKYYDEQYYRLIRNFSNWDTLKKCCNRPAIIPRADVSGGAAQRVAAEITKNGTTHVSIGANESVEIRPQRDIPMAATTYIFVTAKLALCFSLVFYLYNRR